MHAYRSFNPPRKLLFVDGDARLLSAYRELLRPYGFEVLTASDEENAVSLARRHPDILLTIVDLDGAPMDCRQWILWYRSLRADSQVLVICPRQRLSEAEGLGLSAILQRPFHVAELLDMVGLFCGLGTPAAMHIT